jgi:hypothetical protein
VGEAVVTYDPTIEEQAWLAELDERSNGHGHAVDPVEDRLPDPVDWHALFANEAPEADWLVEDFWPARRAISIVADHKAGKSLLMFWVACCLARGIDPWSGRTREPITVAYWDYEMTENDLYERAVDEFELHPDDLDQLRYYLLPTVPPLDTPEGGRVVLGTLRRDGARAAVFDTFGRTVTGPEDLSDTVRAYYRCTAYALKAAGIASARLDHTGHTEHNRARGSSGKGDDIDVAWVLKRGDGTSASLNHHGVSRLSWVPRSLDLVLIEGPPNYCRRATERWPAGTAECATALDELELSLDVGANEAIKALRAARRGRRREVVIAAVRYRHHARNHLPGTGMSTEARN